MREDIGSKNVIWDLKGMIQFARYRRDFILTGIVITEFAWIVMT